MSGFAINGADTVVALTLGGYATGAAASFTGAHVTTLVGRCQTYDIEMPGESSDMRGMRTQSEMRFKANGLHTITVNRFVTSDGAMSFGNSPNLRGYLARIAFSEISTISVPATYTGIIESCKISASDDNVIETIVIKGPPEMAS